MSGFAVMVLASGIGLGCAGLATALRTRPAGSAPSEVGVTGSAVSVRSFRTNSPGLTLGARRLVLAGLVGIVVGVLTRWPTVAVMGALAALALPRLFTTGQAKIEARRVEAIAVWTELLRDTLAASAGVAQAIVTTAASAPAAIFDQVALLAGRVVSGVPVDTALRGFARDVDDPSADLVVCALVLASTSRAQRLVELLSALADAIRDDVAMRLRVESSRASARSSVRTVVIFSIAFAGALLVVAHSYLAPFGSITGQLVLCIVGTLYAAGLALMARMVRPARKVRLLGAETTP